MSEPAFDTAQLHQQIERIRAGDPAAQEELVRAVGERMRRIAQRMLRGYPGVRAAADTSDVLQNTFLRLLAALRRLRPESTRDFFHLAAYLTRQELIDLLRRCAVRPAVGAADSALDRVAAGGPSSDHLDAWLRFHQAVEQVPVAEREVMSLAFYHGWTQSQIAEVLGLDVRTVRRRWAAGCLSLRELLGDDLEQLLG
jgi:RNA polymerase sigma factor (sigma-70 family)